MSELYLVHHGIKGQKWGVKNGPPYPIENAHKNNAEDINSIHKTFSRKDKDYLVGKGNDFDIIDSKAYRNKKAIPYSKSIVSKGKAISYTELSNVGNGTLNLSVATINDPNYRGKGYASKLVKDAMKWFDEQNIYDKIQWWADVENTSSVNMAVKNGLKYDKTEVLNGQKWVKYVIEKTNVGQIVITK